MPWEIFEREADRYESWYGTRRGRRADRAEKLLLSWLLGDFPAARRVLEIGCGTGHFSRWLQEKGLIVTGLDRSPRMLAEMRRCGGGIPVVLGDAHRLPVRDRGVDIALFVTTLEYLEEPRVALDEAFRAARQGVIALVLNRWSLGSLRRRSGDRTSGLLAQAQDYSPLRLDAMLRAAAGGRLRKLRRRSTLFPVPFQYLLAPVPLGDVVGIAAMLEDGS